MRKTILGIALAIFVLLSGCGKVSGVNETIGPSDIYSEDEIQSAMDVVKKTFSAGFERCILLDLWYDEAVSLKEADHWARQYDAEEAIVLLSNFFVAGSKNPTLNPNSKYENWSWILVRSGGNWELKTSGY